MDFLPAHYGAKAPVRSRWEIAIGDLDEYTSIAGMPQIPLPSTLRFRQFFWQFARRARCARLGSHCALTGLTLEPRTASLEMCKFPPKPSSQALRKLSAKSRDGSGRAAPAFAP